MTDKEKLQEIKRMVEDTHSRFGYYSCRPYLSEDFKNQILNIIEDKIDENS